MRAVSEFFPNSLIVMFQRGCKQLIDASTYVISPQASSSLDNPSNSVLDCLSDEARMNSISFAIKYLYVFVLVSNLQMIELDKFILSPSLRILLGDKFGGDIFRFPPNIKPMFQLSITNGQHSNICFKLLSL